MTTSQAAATRTETRLALVMNGGVSLAVWMGGVTHELELLRRASRGITEGVAEADIPVLRIWQRLAEHAKTELTIDIIAGTSAGGLNGMLLATALARNAPMPDLRSVWEESAALKQLLKPLTGKSSVLNGDRFEREIRKAVRRIEPGPGRGMPVTLFLTSTALDGPNRVYTDGFGSEFDVRDHRRLYRFRHGERVRYKSENGQGWDFTRDQYSDFGGIDDTGATGALVRAARATAGFPVAFPAAGEDGLLGFRVRPEGGVDSVPGALMDGGVLDNAPFGPVLEAITRRKLDRPVRRVLVYVVPSAGRVAQESHQGHPLGQVPWHTSALNAVRYPAESSFRAGTDELSSRLRNNIRDIQLDLFTRMTASTTLTTHLTQTAEKLLPEYRRNRALAVIEEVRTRNTSTGTVEALVASTQADSGRIDAILGKDAPADWVEPNWTPRWDASQEGRQIQEVHGPWTEWRWGTAAAERILQLLSCHLHAQCSGPDTPPLTPDQRITVLEAARALSDRLLNVLAVEDSVHAELGTATGLSDEEVGRLLHDTFARLNVPRVLAELVTGGGEEYAAAMRDAGLGNGWTGQEVVSAALTVELVTRVYSPPGQIVEPLTPTFEFLRLGPDRTSPLFDEGEFHRQRDRKLYGIRLQHFGAFADKEWRTSDFVWGRLDAALHLLDLLGVADPLEQEQLHRAILDAESRKAPLACDGAGAPDGDPRQWMRGHLKELKKGDKELLGAFAASEQGRESVQDVTVAVMSLLETTGQQQNTDNTSSSPTKGWTSVVSYGRTVFARGGDHGRLDSGERRPPLRLATLYMRRRFWTTFDKDPVKAPVALAQAMRRTFTVAGLLAAVGAFAVLTPIGWGIYALVRRLTR